MEIAVCIGSSCHLKGSRQVVEGLQKIIAEKNLADKINLCGRFCMGNCQNGVCVTVDGQLHSVKPDGVQAFFDKEVASKL
ncbi:MAG: (2Fe-2S) ferredoxin domain-containing protein [bacterium]|nr:(2Fe-2S) ferredoxin domain-containing protein [bacterium]